MSLLKSVPASLCAVLLLAPFSSQAQTAQQPEKVSLGIARDKLTYKAKMAQPAGGVAALADAPPDVADAASVPDQDELQKKVDAIIAKYKPELDQQTKIIDDESKDKKGPLTVDGKCQWEQTSAKFDIPKTTFKNREFSFDLPKTSFKLRHFSYDYPHCDWKMMRIAGIKTKFLKCGKRRKEWSTKIPEFNWGRSSFSTKIPEFKWDTTEVKFHTLKCSVKDIYVGMEKPKEQGKIDQAGRNIESLVSRQQSELQAVVEEDLDARGERLALEIDRVKGEFDAALAQMDESIAELASNGMDPNSVMVEIDGKSVSLVGARAAIAAQRDAIVTQMSDEWRKTLEEMRKAA